MILMAVAMFLPQLQAVPAEGNPVKVKQPDGTYLTIRLVGDEFMSFNVTEDGFTVVKNEEGYYVYAQQAADGELVPTTQIAHDEAQRQGEEQSFLRRTKKFLQPKMTPAMAAKKQREYGLRRQASEVHRAPKYDYTKFRGLVVLVEYNDRTFGDERYKDIITDMISKENYTGYVNYNNARVNCTGSVVDYFRDNSMGAFVPQFDVIGPVTVDRSQYYANKTANTTQLTYDVINLIDKDVNFANYDGDNDGVVDMIYFVFAGHPSSYTGNDQRLIWPHAYYIYQPMNGYIYNVNKDGKRLGRYACSTELQGPQTGNTISGIGTICHEFSHVLGLPDFYDTDYAEGGGQSNDPSSWTLMSQGCYLNNSRTPCGYSLFERYMAGFATPQVIEEGGSYTLEKINTSNAGFRINTPVKKEYFILENRQKERWDAYLPGHGLLVFRVDSTNTTVWSNNQLNTNPKHNYYELVRARGTGVSAAADPFPGTGRVTTLNNVTTPANLKTWAGKETKFGLLNIKETNGVITFDIEDTYVLRELLVDENLQLGVGVKGQVTVTPVPEYASYTLTWSSADENIAKVDQEGVVEAISTGETDITVSSNTGLSATCHVKVVKLPETDEIAEFKTFDENEESILNLSEAQVLYVHNNNVYLRDNTGAIILEKTKDISMKQNDIISGKLVGKLTHVNDMPHLVLTSTNLALTITDGAQVEPRQLSATELSEAYYADLVKVKTVELVRASNVFIVDNDGNQRARLYNVFGVKGLSLPSNINDKRYDIVGIYGTHPSGSTIIEEIYLLQSPIEDTSWVPTGINEVEANGLESGVIYNLQGQKLTSLKKGINIVGGKKIVVP